MTKLFANNASSRMAVQCLSTNDSVQVLAGEGAKFPAPTAPDFFTLTLEDRRTGQIEITHCTGRVGDLLYVTRAQEGTTAQNFAAYSTASNRVTAGTLQEVIESAGFNQDDADSLYVNLTGDTMTGPLQLSALPVLPTEAANKAYVDAQAAVGTFPEAPTDAKIYGRRDAAWAETLTKTQIDADNATQNAAIAAKISEAPTDGQQYARQNSAWTVIVPDSGDVGATVSVADAPPISPANGDLWWESDSGNLYVWYVDLSGPPGQWVQVNGVDSPATGITGAEVLAALLGVDGAGSGLDADFLDGQSGAYYLALANHTGTISTTQHGNHPGGALHAVATGSLPGFMSAADKTKLDGFAVGGDMSGAQILTALAPVDGTGSGLDADLLDGQSGGYYQSRTNHTGAQAQSTIVNLTTDLAAKAALASPALTGTPTAPTATAGTNTTQIATTAFVGTAVAAGGGGGGLADAPSDGLQYVRQNGAWNSFIDAETLDGVSQGFYLSRGNHTGQQPMSSIADAGTAAKKNLHVGTTAPASPAVNDLWVDTT